MTSEPLELDTSSPRIDHFSHLPNELLDNIFEYAHEDSRPIAPLSKRLFPFFEKYLYRKVDLSYSAQTSLFLKSISIHPHKGQSVERLSLSASVDIFDNDFHFLNTLFALLPNLLHLTCPRISPLSVVKGHHVGLPPSLESLAIPVVSHFEDEDEDRDCLDLGQLACLDGFPRLTDLTLYDWTVYEDGAVYGSQVTRLGHIKSLRVVGIGAEDESVERLTEICPALSQLDLHSTWADEVRLYAALDHHPISLQALSLSAEYDSITYDEQDKLRRFTNLRSINLGNHSYSYTIHTVLCHLPLLVHLHLGRGPLNPAGLQTLLSGPTRLLSLKSMTIDLYEGKIGSRIARPSNAGCRAEAEISRCPIKMRDWLLPGEDRYDTINAKDLSTLNQLAQVNGVRIEGNVERALENAFAYRIEANNRATIDALNDQQFDHLEEVRYFAACDGVSLPPLDLDSLDLDRLEIVEIDLPEREWFMLNLRNKE